MSTLTQHSPWPIRWQPLVCGGSFGSRRLCRLRGRCEPTDPRGATPVGSTAKGPSPRRVVQPAGFDVAIDGPLLSTPYLNGDKRSPIAETRRATKSPDDRDACPTCNARERDAPGRDCASGFGGLS